MSNQINLTVDTTEKKQSFGDMFGIFFEDLNHAADGGLYGELIRNRSFEFDEIDNRSYNHLTAWNISGLKNDGENGSLKQEVNTDNIYGTYAIENEMPLSEKNPHYLTVNIKEGNMYDISKNVSIVNEGFNTGLFLEKGKEYNFSIYCMCYENDMSLMVSLTDGEEELAENVIAAAGDGWKNYRCVFTPDKTTYNGRLKVQFLNSGKISLDHISLFPRDTFLQKENGLRADIASMLKDLKPKFMRFPGGCLVHDGSLNADDRDSMYRWKNTIGDVTKRPARRSNWGYNQTLGLGYYEYFCFCEEIGTKALPVLPGGYNPHRQISAPLSEIGEWVQDALDLIEFANGDETTEWGKIRAELGHKEPFNLEYIAIGNEEVGEAFFERYPFFHNAIKEKYPDIKIISTSGPFAAGSEFERGWKSAIENKADLVDEHYYMAPEWFLAHMDRYSEYKEENPKVFLGEYATWGNTWYNALVEAAYMTRMQENAHAVGLACYAPLLCNVGYVNWRPDLIWYNNHQVYGTANYYVQKMFMHHQGDYLLKTKAEGMETPYVKYPVDFSGDIVLRAIDGAVTYSDIEVINNDTEETLQFGDKALTRDDNSYKLMTQETGNYTIRLKAKQDEGRKGFLIEFGKKDEGNRYFWELGGWQNLDATICHNTNRRGSCLTQSEFSVDFEHTYELMITVKDNGEIKAFVDGRLFQTTRSLPALVEDIYVTSALEEPTGDIIIKTVNIDEKEKTAKITLAGLENKNYTVMVEDIKDIPVDSENSFDEPVKICPKQREITVTSNTFEYVFPKESVTVLRVKK
ncbi:MAG: alpha-L-arabinofuranosidase [Lachnospiraceae bacterium]